MWFPSAIYIDPSNVSGLASDANDGQTSATPLLTFAEVTRRFGGTSPQLSQTLAITWMSDQLASANPDDLVCFAPFAAQGCTMTGQLVQVDTGTFSAVTNDDPSTNTLATCTASGKPSNFWTAYVGYLVHDTTADVWFCVEADSGSATAQASGPLNAAIESPPGTIAASDAFIVYKQPKIFLADFSPTPVGGNAVSSLTTLAFALMGGTFYPAINIECDSMIVDRCAFFDIANLKTTGQNLIAQNCYFDKQVVAREAVLFGGTSKTLTSLFGGCICDANVRLHGDVEFWYTNDFGQVYSDVPTLHLIDGYVGMSGDLFLRDGTSFTGAAVLWGTSQLAVHTGCNVYYDGTAVSKFKNTGGIVLNGLSTAYAPLNGGGFNQGPYTISPANIDNAAMFAGTAENPLTRSKIALWS